jgi:hypothetical protein
MKNVRPKNKKLTLDSETIRRLRSLETMMLVRVRGGLELETGGGCTHSDCTGG